MLILATSLCCAWSADGPFPHKSHSCQSSRDRCEFPSSLLTPTPRSRTVTGGRQTVTFTCCSRSIFTHAVASVKHEALARDEEERGSAHVLALLCSLYPCCAWDQLTPRTACHWHRLFMAAHAPLLSLCGAGKPADMLASLSPAPIDTLTTHGVMQVKHDTDVERRSAVVPRLYPRQSVECHNYASCLACTRFPWRRFPRLCLWRMRIQPDRHPIVFSVKAGTSIDI